jgi:hypothetical protein
MEKSHYTFRISTSIPAPRKIGARIWESVRPRLPAWDAGARSLRVEFIAELRLDRALAALWIAKNGEQNARNIGAVRTLAAL